MADIFDRIAGWLQRTALHDVGLDELVEHLCQRLIDGGVPVARLSLGRMLMHPVIGLVDVTWNIDSHRAEWTILPRRTVTGELFDQSPFGEITKASHDFARNIGHLRGLELADEFTEFPHIHDDLTDPATRGKYKIYQQLAASGMTSYAAYSVPFGMRSVEFGDGADYLMGASVSYATKRMSGFTERELAGFESILVPLMATARIVTERYLATELMEAYLGRISGQSVLNGQIARGDVRRIDCALVYSDMHGSTGLSLKLSPEDFVSAVNRYFDCVAGAVQDHGGEVLKFVGDGLLAIFPFDGRRRMPEDMCAAALSAAREAFRRRDGMDAAHQMKFGIALHMGAAVYGNVGTEKRLDFTVTGSSVATVGRLEEMTRTLGSPLLSSGDFAALVPDKGKSLGAHALRGFDEKVEIVSFDAAG